MSYKSNNNEFVFYLYSEKCIFLLSKSNIWRQFALCLLKSIHQFITFVQKMHFAIIFGDILTTFQN